MQIKKTNTLGDVELIAQYKLTNDNTYVGILFQRYTHIILGICMKYLRNEEDAQDASILIFEKLLVDIPQYDILDFKKWLFSFCKTFCLMYTRSANSKYKMDSKIENNLDERMEFDQNLHLIDEESNEMRYTFMDECMEGLNKDQRLCLELFFLKEKSYNEMVDETKFTMNNVKSHIQNGKRNLKNCIESKMY